jgi:hypothetical protein
MNKLWRSIAIFILGGALGTRHFTSRKPGMTLRRSVTRPSSQSGGTPSK